MGPEDVRERLRSVKYPGFSRDIVSFGIVKDIQLDAHRTQVRLALPTENKEVADAVVAAVDELLASIEGLAPADIVVERPRGQTEGAPPPGAPAHSDGHARGHAPSAPAGVSRTIAVASGKGGVGKSTVASNLAVALAAGGASVGLLDADIYGPSVPTMFGIGDDERLATDDEGRFIPHERFGVKLISMGFFVARGAPLIWRGPMLTKALGQFLGDVDWSGVDYLLVDLPPGTGDVQMTLTQNLKIDAGIIVTTPQDVALADVERGIKMFKQASVPVSGVIENMSYHLCSGCGKRSHVFGEGGGRRVAEQHGVAFLGGVPLLRTIREGGDFGVPLAAIDGSELSSTFGELARRMTIELPVGQVGHA
ncbi:MAG: Mrp/NBP35 family ATP-binding protein [Deltaproteobacteria bacterium]